MGLLYVANKIVDISLEPAKGGGKYGKRSRTSTITYARSENSQAL